MKIGIVGSRLYENKRKIKETIFELKRMFGEELTIFSGGSGDGADKYAKKYALGNLLLIDDTADSDATNTHGKSSAASFPPTKPSLKRNSDEWQSALDYVKDNGKGSTSKIESKYNISDKDKLFLESHEIRHASL